MYLSLIENWNRSRNDNLFLKQSSFKISENAMLWVKVCRYAVVDADFYRGWDIVMRENCMCQCCIVRCTKTLHWDTKLFSGAAERRVHNALISH